MAVRISQVSFEHHRIALGIGEPNPRISWQFEGNWPNWTQGGYSIEIARDGEIQPQLFHFNSSESVLVPWPTASLASAESASIRVKAHGEDDHPDTPWSQIVNVETGLLNPVDWSDALMMAADKETEKDQPHQPVLFRKEFRVHGVAQKARLYITAYGLYETFINGQRVGDLVLAPGWQSYKHRLVYDTYDVTDFLRDGENVIGVQVGEGWYAGRLGFNGGSRNLWGDTLGALALLTFTGPDGTREVVRTDKTWSASTGAIITSELYDGETYDSRLEQPGWAAAGFEALETTKWAGVKELNGPSGQLAAPDDHS
ncbi:alpha-L-rhamnosidase N-terminal domain-containing protein [Xylariaceae sp. FL0662B]|nr:alpha-L-rhamnosidase N-terminal domain-containing protein [Xylariaceae sp. FL0662B]